MNPEIRGLTYTLTALALYLLIVVATTPNMSPASAVVITLMVNAPFLVPFLAAFFVNGYLVGKVSQSRYCKLNRKALGSASASGAVLSSLVSFLTLTSVGCCSMWLYILSLLAGSGSLGVVFVGLLLDASSVIMVLGLTAMWIVNVIVFASYLRLSRYSAK